MLEKTHAENPTLSKLDSRNALKTSLGPFRIYEKLIKKDGERLFLHRQVMPGQVGKQLCVLEGDVKLEESKGC